MYTNRQLQIIRYFLNVYLTYGKNAEQYPILVWRDEDNLGFIYPQEVEELIDNGCRFFTVTYHKPANMWTSPNFKISRAILEAAALVADIS